LPLNEDAVGLAEALVTRGPIPPSEPEDALHIAIAAVYGMDYLLTWNCRHIANAEITPAIHAICRDKGFSLPEICTPEELMGT